MAIHDVWLENLKKLVALEGGGRKGIRAVADASDLSEEYVYQLTAEKPNRNGERREVGVGAAKKISKSFGVGKPAGWFDMPIQAEKANTTNPPTGFIDRRLSSTQGAPPDLKGAIGILAQSLASIDPVDRAAAKAYLMGLCDAPDRKDLLDKVRTVLEPPASHQGKPEIGAKRTA